MLVFALSPLSYFLFALANKHVDLAVAGSLINTIVVAGAVIVGVFVFGEELSRTQFAGIAMAMVAMTLLNIG